MVKLAKTAGFCFGVRNAVRVVEELLKAGKRVCTLGPLIHSPQVVEDFGRRGVRVLEDPSKVHEDECLVIRSHGVGPFTHRKIQLCCKLYKDATCPFVKRIHKKVFEAQKSGKTILVAGDIKHPEVIGIVGYCGDRFFVFGCFEELRRIMEQSKNVTQEDIFVVSQTTFNFEVWQECTNYLKKICKNIVIFNSICSATIDRQAEAILLSKKSDIVIVVGGRNSSNTKKLYELCLKNCETYLVETKKELVRLNLCLKDKNIAITAGASAPDFLIDEIFTTVLEYSK